MEMLVTGIIMTEQRNILRLMTWMSPAFPVGGFVWSGGLEAACRGGSVMTAEDLQEWLGTSLRSGTLRNESILLAAAHRQAEPLAEINDLALALAGSRERHAETSALGRAFVKAARPWNKEPATELPVSIAYPVAVGQLARANGVALSDTLIAFLNAAISSQVQAALRLMPLGQQAGVEIVAALEQAVLDLVASATLSTLDDLGGAAIAMDIATMKHEVLQSRLFSS